MTGAEGSPSLDAAAGEAGRSVARSCMAAGVAGLGSVVGVGSAGSVVGVGIDAVDLDRFRALLVRRPSLERRLFTPAEREYAGALADPVPRLATRFAAKEAVMKSLGVGLGAFAFAEVEVARRGLDAPRLVLHGGASSLAERAGVVHWHLSLTHTGQVAMAVVLAAGGMGARMHGPTAVGS